MKTTQILAVLFALNSVAAFAGPLEQESTQRLQNNNVGAINSKFVEADADELNEIMHKAAGLSPDAMKIIGHIPEVNELNPGTNYVHELYDAVESSGSVIFDFWNAYKSGPLYFTIGGETCSARKMTYRHTYPWSKKNDGSTLLFRCYEASKESRAFEIGYGLDHEISGVEDNLDGEIGTRTTIDKNGKKVVY